MLQLRPITEIAYALRIPESALEPYGHHKAKIDTSKLNDKTLSGKLVLVTAITPNKAGIGKTVNTIGLSMALNRLGKKAIAVLREPSLGPCFGMKGGAAGGGASQVEPAVDINLHFNGDFHAITSAHNMLAALLDNHLYQNRHIGRWKEVYWKRVLDVNDRSLRHMLSGLGGTAHGVPAETGFDITPASEIMALLCLADGAEDLLHRINRIILGKDQNGNMVSVGELGFGPAIAILLKDAIKPNLAQTSEGTPAIIHGGPFANIAHGCNSLQATRLALQLGEIAVTEAGFGSDLGGEKFFDIKCRIGGLKPAAAVLVCSLQALKLHGGATEITMKEINAMALEQGMLNLERHLANLSAFGVPVVVAINRFPWDTEPELQWVQEWCAARKVQVAVTECFARGGAGSESLGQLVLETMARTEITAPNWVYQPEDSLEQKVSSIVRRVYGGAGAAFSEAAKKKIKELEQAGYGHLPVCIAKTQYSFSADPKVGTAAAGFTLPVREVVLNAGAGFVVCIAGDIMRMPGLPKVPQALNMRLDEDGTVHGVG
ncbi:MAG: formate--tetrahydrofolate ligase [Bacteroidetes bacterium]|nr:formate--tetrahydrofolate ligase [Bacteroidota bacterium]